MGSLERQGADKKQLRWQKGPLFKIYRGTEGAKLALLATFADSEGWSLQKGEFIILILCVKLTLYLGVPIAGLLNPFLIYVMNSNLALGLAVVLLQEVREWHMASPPSWELITSHKCLAAVVVPHCLLSRMGYSGTSEWASSVLLEEIRVCSIYFADSSSDDSILEAYLMSIHATMDVRKSKGAQLLIVGGDLQLELPCCFGSHPEDPRLTTRQLLLLQFFRIGLGGGVYVWEEEPRHSLPMN